MAFFYHEDAGKYYFGMKPRNEIFFEFSLTQFSLKGGGYFNPKSATVTALIAFVLPFFAESS